MPASVFYWKQINVSPPLLQFDLGKLWENGSKLTPTQWGFVVVIFLIIGGFAYLNKKLVPGTELQASRDKERDDTVGVLKTENERLRLVVAERDKEIKGLYHEVRNVENTYAAFVEISQNPDALRLRAEQLEEKRKSDESRNRPD